MLDSTRPERDAPYDFSLSRAVVPVLAAVGAVTLAIALARADLAAPSPLADAAPQAAAASGTAYSADHRRVEEAPGEPQPLPPTF